MSGVDIYHQILDAVEFYDYLGLRFVEDADSEVYRMQIPADGRLRAPPGHVHGGVLTSLVDVAALYAVWRTYGAPGGLVYTTELSVSFENSTTRGVTAHARVQSRESGAGRDELAVDVSLFELPESHEFGTAYAPGADPEQTLVATADLSFVVLDDGEPASQTGRA